MITFCIAIYGSKYLPCLKVLVQSICELYTPEECRIIISCSDLKRKLLRPFRKIEQVTLFASQLSMKATRINRRKQHRVALRTRKWAEMFEAFPEAEKVVLLDSDMMVVQDLRSFFDGSFDFAFTYKTEKSENLRFPVNSGLVMCTQAASGWMKEWASNTERFLNDPLLFKYATKKWGAPCQAALSEMVGYKRETGLYSKEVEGLRLKGFECSRLNEVRCVSMTDDLYVIHYKGQWPLEVIEEETTEARQAMKARWFETLRRFEQQWEKSEFDQQLEEKEIESQ